MRYGHSFAQFLKIRDDSSFQIYYSISKTVEIERDSSFRFAPFGMTVANCIGGRRERSLWRPLSSSSLPLINHVIPSGARNLNDLNSFNLHFF